MPNIEEKRCENMEKIVATKTDVEFEYFDKYERPILAFQGLSSPFSAFYPKNRLSFNKNGCEKFGAMGRDMTAFCSMPVYGF